MRTTLALAAALGVAALAGPLEAQRAATATTRLMDDVRWLADDRLEGRMIGTPGADSAAEYIARRFAQVGLQAGAGGWFQPFTVTPSMGRQGRAATPVSGRNVVGILPGSDPRLRHETVIVGAHYDHLGLGGFGALDEPGQVHNGADDNASGTAALIQIAARLAATPPARTVVFLAFSGEELGLLGSGYYTREPVYPLAQTRAMVNLDMVGRLRDDKLIVYGTETAKEFRALLDSLNRDAGFELRQQGDGFGPSDHSSFYAAKLPVLHLFTDLHEDYHRATDDWDKINVEGLGRVVEFTADLVRSLADRPRELTFNEYQPPAPHGAAAGPVRTGGYGAYLGTIPDMGAAVERGVRISGVRAGSPAEKAGLVRDDVIVKIGETDVPDLQAMTDALRSHVPGDTVGIVVVRGGEARTLTAVLGSRGG